MIFAESGLSDLLSLFPCFETEGSELRLAAFSTVPVAAVGVTEVDGVGSCAKTVGNSKVKLYIGWKNGLRFIENHRTVWCEWLVVC